MRCCFLQIEIAAIEDVNSLNIRLGIKECSVGARRYIVGKARHVTAGGRNRSSRGAIAAGGNTDAGVQNAAAGKGFRWSGEQFEDIRGAVRFSIAAPELHAPYRLPLRPGLPTDYAPDGRILRLG